MMLSSAIKRIDTSVRQAERVYRDVLVRCGMGVWNYNAVGETFLGFHLHFLLP